MESAVSVFEEFAMLKKTKELCDVHLTTKSAWIIYLLFLCTGEGVTNTEKWNVLTTLLAERSLGEWKQATYFTTHYLYDLGQIT